MNHKESTWYLYIIETDKGLLYTGITTDVQRRLREHRGLEGKNKGAKFFRGRYAQAVRYIESHKNRSEASKRESEIKKLGASSKRALFESGF